MAYRKTEVLRDGAWVEVPFEALKKGDRLRMFEPSGEPVTDWTGKKMEFEAAEDAYSCPGGPGGLTNYAIRCK